MTALSQKAIVIGGGPAGLMAAEVLSAHGIKVDLYDAMPSVGRKFLLAGVGGMNITHSEAPEQFLKRYREAEPVLKPMLSDFSAADLRSWIHDLGIDTFVGSSGRVFPTNMKAAPLLRAWLHRLKNQGVVFHVRHRWQGWDEEGHLVFDTPTGQKVISAGHATILALGGASWKKLGSDGAWAPWLQQQDISIARLQPSNCGFDTNWSNTFKTQAAGQPLKSVVLSLNDSNGQRHQQKGELIISESGLEGSLVYALSAPIREQINREGFADIELDLKPAFTVEQLESRLSKPRGKDSITNHLRKKINISKQYASILRECVSKDVFQNFKALAYAIKHVPVRLLRPRPIDEAISTAGGVKFKELDEQLMLKKLPGVFCAGEMLNWEAPTGGYLLTACFATGRRAGLGAVNWLMHSKEHVIDSIS